MSSDELAELMEADFEDNKKATSVEQVDQKGLTSVAGLARLIRDKEVQIDSLETSLKESKKALQKLTDEEMPAMLAEIGISSFSLDDGSTVEVKQTYGASILVQNRPTAFEWLRDHQYDDIIKNTVLCQFGRGEDDQASAFSAFAETQGFIPQQKTEIHPQTLRAFVKERCEAGEEFPMELFGAWVGQRAVIKRGK
jgi:16S rRNA C1402 N4-methylase RsmH|tara:strand:- start:315 stop:902 length:588 start_codon:yes stop_codon:yes gene_type:complete